ncbi:unnamed protein product [Cuscuta campestris]|uniref:Uncharacterized protein n=1 Tax=Cuscuta campestris TaxID=132261 RepID=A0A484LGJ6_9ASTE|nr:unnamed protein product [Cuscuta campestris]
MAAQTSDPMDRLPTGLKLFVRNLQSLTPVKLDDTNYPSWSATVRANLVAHRLLGYVDGSEVPPSPLNLDEKAAAPGKDAPPVMKPNPAYDSWVLVDAQIRACLLAIVSPTVQTHIHALPSSAAIWNHLEQRYNSLSRTHIFQLKERLHSIQKGTDSMQTYLDTVLTIVSSLKLAHEDISEQDIILTRYWPGSWPWAISWPRRALPRKQLQRQRRPAAFLPRGTARSRWWTWGRHHMSTVW